MDIYKLVDSRGIVQKQNPNYNAKAKKNKQPKYIYEQDLGKRPSSSLVEPLANNVEDRFFINDEEVKKYREYGLNYANRIGSINKELADSQSLFSKTFNALAQTVVSEIGLGTVRGFSDLFGGFFDLITGQVFKDDYNYTNALSDVLQKAEDAFNNEVAPIYTDPNIDIQNGGLLSWSWYMKNLPSIASSITLLLPARAVSLGVGKLARFATKAGKAGKAFRGINEAKAGKAINNAEKATMLSRAKELDAVSDADKVVPTRWWHNPTELSKAQATGKMLGEAAMMRVMENYQESSQTYTEAYSSILDELTSMSNDDYAIWCEQNKNWLENKGISTKDKAKIAKTLASDAATRTFQIDAFNVVFDIAQLRALKDFSKLRNSVSSTSVRAAHRQSMQILGKSDDAAKAILNVSRGTKIKNRLKDFITGSGKVALAESTEGIEEAVNYIAQQEGLSYGKSMIDRESEFTRTSFWNQRLWKYLGDSELQESAFWGVLGGITFSAGGNALNKIKIKQANEKQEKLLNELGINKETDRDEKGRVNPLNNWITLWDNHETKAAKEAINRRNQRAELLRDKMAIIKEGKNPFRQAEDGQYAEFNNEVERKLVEDKIVSEYIVTMTMDALNSGTYDMLVEYMENKQVRAALADMGATGSDNTSQFFDKVINRMESISTLYNNELAHVNAQVSALNAQHYYDEQIPLNYIQQIAVNNIRKKLILQDIDRQENTIRGSLPELMSSANMDASDVSEFENIAYISYLTDQYSRLEADKKHLLEGKEVDSKGRPLSKWVVEEHVSAINTAQHKIREEIQNTFAPTNEQNDNTGVAKATAVLMNTIRRAKTYVRVGENYSIDRRIQTTDEQIIEEFESLYKDGKFTPTIQEEKVDDKTNKSFGDDIKQYSAIYNKQIQDFNSKEGIYGQSNQLWTALNNIADLKVNRVIEKGFIYSTQKQILFEVDRMHNSYNEARRDIIEDARLVMTDMAKKYSGNEEIINDLEDIIISAYKRNPEEAQRIAEKVLSKEDASKFLNALTTLNFSFGANERSYLYILKELDKHKELKNPDVQQGTETEGQEETQTHISDKTQQVDLDNDPRNKSNISIAIDDNGNIESIRPSNPVNDQKIYNVVGLEEQDGSIELAITNLDENDRDYLSSKTDLFTIDEAAINPNAEVVISSNPVISKIVENGKTAWKVIKKGVIGVAQRAVPPVVPPTGEGDNQQGGGSNNQGQGQRGQQGTGGTQGGQGTQRTQGTQGTGGTRRTQPQPIELSDNELVIINQEAKKHYSFDSPTFDKDNLRQEIINGLNALEDSPIDTTSQLVSDEIDKVVNKIERSWKLIKEHPNSMIAAAVRAAHACLEESSTNVFSNFFTSTIDDLMQQYADTVTLQSFESGEILVSLKDIMFACREAGIVSDSVLTYNVFTKIKNYLTSPEGKAKYIVTDLNEVTSENIINIIGTATQDTEGLLLGGFNEQTIDYKWLIDDSKRDKESVERSKKTLAKLKRGDTIRGEHERNSKEIVFYDKNGNIVGSLHKPEKTADGKYVVYNGGLRYDLIRNADGTISSELKDTLISWFTEQYWENEQLVWLINRAIPYRYSQYENEEDIPEELSEILERFEQNPYIEQAINQSYENYGNNIFFIERETETDEEGNEEEVGNIDTRRILNSLIDIYKVATSRPALTNEDRMNNIRDSIERWFNKLTTNYDTIGQAPFSFEAEVMNMVDGEKIELYPSSEIEQHYDELPPASQAIADMTTARIAIVNPMVDGEVVYSDPSSIDSTLPSSEINPAMRKGGTKIAIFGKSKYPQYIGVAPVRLTDAEIQNNKFIYNLIAATSQHLKNELSEFLEGRRTKTQILTLFKSIFADSAPTSDFIPLFRARNGGIEIHDTVPQKDKSFEGFEITFVSASKKDDISIQFFTTSKQGNPGFQIMHNDRTTGTKTPLHTVFDRRSNRTYSMIFNTNPDRRKAFIDTFVTKATKELVKRCMINISYTGVLGDNTKQPVNNGYLTRKIVNGKSKIILDIPLGEGRGIYQEYDSYNDFILQNDLLKVNTRIENGSNITPNVNNLFSNPRITINIPIFATTTPVEESVSLPQQQLTEREKVINTINNTNANVGTSLARKILDNDSMSRLEQEASAAGIDVNSLFPESIMYHEGLNIQNEDGSWKGNVAEASSRNMNVVSVYRNGVRRPLKVQEGTVVLGDRWLALATGSQGKRYQAIRKLIHEQIHILLGNGKYKTPADYEELTNLASDFWNAVNDTISKYGNKADSELTQDERILKLSALQCKQHLGRYVAKVGDKEYLETRFIEEFLAEGITNKDLFEFMNRIKVTNPTTSKKESLFSRFINFITRLFGWHVQDGSMYAEFLNTLRNLEEITEENRPITDEEVKEIEDKEIEIPENATPELTQAINNLNAYKRWQQEHIEFDDDTHIYYYVEPGQDENGENVVTRHKITTSVTSFKSNSEEALEGYSFASQIGNEVDRLTREFFLGIDVRRRNYPNLTETAKENLIKDLENLKTYLENKYPGCKIVTNEIRLVCNAKDGTETISLAGTMDMLLIDAKGDFHILDMKAKNKDITSTDGTQYSDRVKYTKQLNGYAQMYEKIINGAEGRVKDFTLLWFRQDYPPLVSGASYSVDSESKLITITTPNGNEMLMKNFNGWTTPRLNHLDEKDKSLVSLNKSPWLDGVERYSKPEEIITDSDTDEHVEGIETEGYEESDSDEYSLEKLNKPTDAVDDDPFNNIGDDDFDMFSSMNEELDWESVDIVSIQAMESTLPIEVRNEFNNKINNGILTLKCK